MVRALAAGILGAVLCVAPAWAEIVPSVELDLTNTVTRNGEEDWKAFGAGTARLSFQSTGNENVRAHVRLDGVVADTVDLRIARAFLKVNFPAFRTTHGKAPVDWGEGFLFNAGDVIFGATVGDPDITADEFRDDAVWQTALWIPLGPFSFAEALVLAPELNLEELLAGSADEPPDAEDTAGGARVLAKVGGAQLEVGYLYRGAERTHNPEISLQGHLGVDVYASGTLSIPQDSPDEEALLEGATASLGLYHLVPLRGYRDIDLALRLEALIRPDGAWEEEAGRSDYGLQLYQELIVNLGPSLALLTRNFVSPIDLSALMSLGVDWNVYEGLRLLSFVAVQAGENEDVYGWNKEGGLAVTAGMEFLY